MRLCDSFELSRNEVHIWTLPTKAARPIVEMFEPILSRYELDRAARFRCSHLSESFVIVRGALRCLLAYYLDIHPTSVRLIHAPKGNQSWKSGLISSSTLHPLVLLRQLRSR
jgi:hypothetical protein